MKKTIIGLLVLFLGTTFSWAQNAGTYDATFSGDGKVLDTASTFNSVVIKNLNNVYVFYEANGAINLLLLDNSGGVISRNVVIQSPNLTYGLDNVKLANNGTFVLSYLKQEVNQNYDNTDPYWSGIAVLNSNGTLNTDFSGDGMMDLVSGTIYTSSYFAFYLPKFDIYYDNSILVGYVKEISANDRLNFDKINTSGTVTNNFLVGTPSVFHDISDVHINSDNSVYISGQLNSITLPHTNAYIYKLTPSFTYDISFNTTGKLVIDRGESYPIAHGAHPFHELLTTSGTDVFLYYKVQDTTNQEDLCLIHKYSNTGAFVNEKILTRSYGGDLENVGIETDINGNLVLLGTYWDSSASAVTKTQLIRLLASNLTYDNTFDGDGKKLLSFTSGDPNYAHSLFIQSDNKILVSSSYDSGEFALLGIARINGTAVTAINEIENPNISVYPNPVTNSFSVNGIELDGKTIVITDNLGKTIKTIVANQGNTVNVQELSNGLYFVTVLQNNQKLANTKIIIQN